MKTIVFDHPGELSQERRANIEACVKRWHEPGTAFEFRENVPGSGFELYGRIVPTIRTEERE